MVMRTREKRVANRLENVLNQLLDLVEAQVDRAVKSLKLPERKEVVYLQQRLAKLEDRLSQIPAAKRVINRGREVATKVSTRVRGRIGRSTGKSYQAAGAKKCKIHGCNRPVKARGLCGTHYQAARRRGEFK